MFFSTKIFHPQNAFKGKRVAVIGAADSAFEEKNGDYIDAFDVIVRVNKAPHSWSPEKAKFIGSRTDILFHSFYENNESGGGPIDFDLYTQQGIKKIVNPYSNYKGYRTHLNYYKRNLTNKLTYILPIKIYKEIINNFNKWIPTVGYSALRTVLNSGCKEIYITGFTFFKTPYASNYRDQLTNMDANRNHIKNQGLHNPDLELLEFVKQYDKVLKSNTTINLDNALNSIVEDCCKIK